MPDEEESENVWESLTLPISPIDSDCPWIVGYRLSNPFWYCDTGCMRLISCTIEEVLTDSHTNEAVLEYVDQISTSPVLFYNLFVVESFWIWYLFLTASVIREEVRWILIASRESVKFNVLVGYEKAKTIEGFPVTQLRWNNPRVCFCFPKSECWYEFDQR